MAASAGKTTGEPILKPWKSFLALSRFETAREFI